MCTVVCRWHPGEGFPVQMLALRDELASRSFDLPGAWWPEQPGVIGGRDRVAGGTWCASDVAGGVTAVVLNRPERRHAAAGAPSRGALPLLALRYRERWTDHVNVVGMAGFNLVLVGPESAQHWWFDGTELGHDILSAGTSMFTPRGLMVTGVDQRLLAGKAHLNGYPDTTAAQLAAEVWSDWLAVVRGTVPSADPSELIVRLPVDADSYETVFGQCIAARPGLVRLDYLLHPARHLHADWTATGWRSGPTPAPQPIR